MYQKRYVIELIADYDWKHQVNTWLHQKNLIEYKSLFIEFFTKAFSNTQIPDKAWFGTTKTGNSLSLVVGRIYLAAYVFSGDEGIWLLLDGAQVSLDGVEYKPVKSTINGKVKLTWLHTKSINSIISINQSPSIWRSFRMATTKVLNTPKGKSPSVNSIISEKRELTSFWSQQNTYDELTEFYQVLNENISYSRKITHEDRLERLKNASSIPEKAEVKTTVYNRNPLVVAEVLYRANGKCEHCKKPAPFFKDDGTPYLEVHHNIPLSENGKATYNLI